MKQALHLPGRQGEPPVLNRVKEMKLLAAISFLLLLGLPVFLIVKGKMNITLGIFYALLGLSVLGEFAGSAALASKPFSTIIAGICGFGIASGIEYVIRRDYLLAAVSAGVLFLFALVCYLAAEGGAFA